MLPAGPAAAVSNNSVASSSGGGGGLGGTRARPIIGLGLTLNPADTLVTLQTRCRRNAQPRAVTDPQAAVAELTRCAEKRHGESSRVSGSPDAAKTPASSTGSSASDGVLFDLALLSPLDIMKSCVSLAESPRNLDPELVSIAGRMHHRSPTTSAPVAEDVQVVPLSPADARPADEPEEPRISEHEQAVDGRRQRSACCLQKPSGPEPMELTCLLCFERVLVPRKRTAAMRCPGCLVSLV
ncbi:hypothetical protein LPJ75_004664 [Coemansia sp. RSA 2598]|nr:hypothetical protein LPJ75_004664 [Coemansia sp. RSA 2598]